MDYTHTTGTGMYDLQYMYLIDLEVCSTFLALLVSNLTMYQTLVYFVKTYCRIGFIHPCFNFTQLTVGEFKTRADKHSCMECIVYIVTEQIQNRSEQKFSMKKRLGEYFAAFYSPCTLEYGYCTFNTLGSILASFFISLTEEFT